VEAGLAHRAGGDLLLAHLEISAIGLCVRNHRILRALASALHPAITATGARFRRADHVVPIGGGREE
jgi:hypothetical protein